MPSTVAPPGSQLLTVKEFMALPEPPDGSLQELVRGRVVIMPSPKGRHGFVCLAIGTELRNFVRPRALGFVASNDSGTILERNPDTVRGPDVAFYSIRRVPELPDGYFEVPPDIAVEVLSPDDLTSKVQSKVKQYLRAGVPIVWVVDPEEQTVAIYTPNLPVRFLDVNDQLDGGDVLPGFQCPVINLFT